MPSNTVSLSAPYTLFALSQPLTITDGKTDKKASLSSLRNIKTSTVVTSPVGASHRKRKRGQAELCAAIDGEGVNIYNAATTQIVSAYALPPATKFSAAPVSLRTTNSDGRAVRRTYAAITGRQSKICSWIETQEDVDSESLTVGPQKTKTLGKKRKISFIELVSHSEKKNSDYDVVIMEQDGNIHALSSDLDEEERWSYSSNWENGKVAFVKSTSLKSIKDSILEDRTAIDFANESTNLEDPVLVILYSTGDNKFHFDVVLLARSNGKVKPQRVLRSNFPTLKSSGTLAFALELSNGKLQIADATSLYAYDLSTPTPSLISELRLSATPGRHTLLQLSPTSVLVSGPEDVILYDTLYSSVQARSTREETTTNASNESVILTTWMDSLNLAVGFSKEGLKAVQLSREGGSGLSFDKEGRLIDSLCRGIGDIEVAHKFPAPVERDLVKREPKLRAGFAAQQKKKKLETGQQPLNCDTNFVEYLYDGLLPTIAKEETLSRSVLERLDNARQKNDIELYEQIFAEYAGVKRHPGEVSARITWKKNNQNKAKEPKLDVSMTNGDVTSGADADDELNKIPEPPTPSFLHPIAYKRDRDLFRLDNHPKPEYRHLGRSRYPDLPYSVVFGVISQMFTLGEDEKLEFDFYSFNILEYLVGCGVFKNTVIGQVKRALGGGSLEPGEIVDALVKEDPTLDLANWYFRFAEEIAVDDVVRGIRVVLQGIEEGSNSGKNLEDSIEAIQETGTSPEAQLQLETLAAERDLQKIDEEVRKMNNREIIIDYSLRRLNRFPTDLIVTSLQSGLTGSQTLSFIKHLQHALTDLTDSADPDATPTDLPLVTVSAENAALIVDILTASLDAVGLTGLILTSDPTTPDSDILISSLHHQVSLSVSSLEESAAVAHLLTELLRHAPPSSLPKPTPKPTPSAPGSRKAAKAILASATPQTPAVLPSTHPLATPTPGAPLFKPTPRAITTGKARRARDRKLTTTLPTLSLGKRLALSAQKGEKKKGKVEPETVLAVRRMVMDMLPIWNGGKDVGGAQGGKRGRKGVVAVGKNELGLGLGNVMGGGRYVVERVDV